jgi:hypothetical protein
MVLLVALVAAQVSTTGSYTNSYKSKKAIM